MSGLVSNLAVVFSLSSRKRLGVHLDNEVGDYLPLEVGQRVWHRDRQAEARTDLPPNKRKKVTQDRTKMGAQRIGVAKEINLDEQENEQ